MDILIIVDMQNDFIDGALGTKEAKAIVPDVAKKIKDFDGEIIYTRDTHEENYLDTQEGSESSGSTLYPWYKRLGDLPAVRGASQRK